MAQFNESERWEHVITFNGEHYVIDHQAQVKLEGNLGGPKAHPFPTAEAAKEYIRKKEMIRIIK